MSLPSNKSLNETFYNSSFGPRRQTPPWILNVPESRRISFTVCYAVILILSVVGNTSIIAIVVRNRTMRTTINYLIANMAATDLASIVVVAARFFSIMHNLSMEWEVPGVLGNIFCRLIPYIRDVSISVSFNSMVAIAFDRFFAVVFPMRATPRVLDVRVLIPVIWCLSLGTFSVHLINSRLISIQGVDLCISRWPSGLDQRKASTVFYISILIVFWLVPLAIIAVLYAIIASRMRRQTIPGQQSSEIEDARRRLNNNIIKMAVAIVFFFFVCWFPYHVFKIMDLFVWRGKLSNVQSYYKVLIFIYCISFVINPYICFTFSSKYRKCVRNLFPFSFFFAMRVGDLGVALQTTTTYNVQRAAAELQVTEIVTTNKLYSHVDTNSQRHPKDNHA